jgi:hypothetical protein
MSLVRKKTFRQWAKALTERGLTVDNADLVAEIGDTVYVKGTQIPIPVSSSITVGFNFISFTVGAVWMNGFTFTYPSFPPGSTFTLPFSRSAESDYIVYCFVPYTAVTDYRPQIPVDISEDEIPNWQVIRIDSSGDIALEIVQEFDVTPEYENTPSIVDSDTGNCSLGWTRRPLIRLTKNTSNGDWAALLIEDPAGLLVFNINTLGALQVELTGSASLI